MGDRTAIEWTDATWNPIRGCSRVSEGCRNCYAERVAVRFSGEGQPYEGLAKNGRWTGAVRQVAAHLGDPLSWRKPRRIFVNSMSDLFHENLERERIDEVFAIMLACEILENRTAHTFQILTKRASRLERYFEASPRELVDRWCKAADGIVTLDNPERLFSEAFGPHNVPFPLPRVWLGVSVEDQATADARVPHLLRVPAAVRFLSCEPLLGSINLRTLSGCTDVECWRGCGPFRHEDAPEPSKGIAWVIVGGESGPDARPMHPEWARSLREQVKAAGVPFFFKQHGEFMEDPTNRGAPRAGELVEIEETDGSKHLEFYKPRAGSVTLRRVGKKKAGRLLDGRTWDEFPEVTHG